MSAAANHWINDVLDWLSQKMHEAAEDARATIAAEISQAPAAELDSLLSVLEANLEQLPYRTARFAAVMQWIASRCVSLANSGGYEEAAFLDPQVLQRLYESLMEGGANEPAVHVLQCLATQSDSDSIESLVELLLNETPLHWQQLGLALSPLWQADTAQLERFFDLLADKYQQPATFSVVIDLANFAVRTARLERHPWHERAKQLQDLLASMTARLRELQEHPERFGDSVEKVQQVLSDSVAMTVSLCDAMALIGNTAAEAVLLDAMNLSHRRIQTEAAGALASLGNEAGRKRLIELAQDPVARLRAVSYAEELGYAEDIDPQLRLPAALAESQLANWLASPEQYGLPPGEMELIESRRQYWPGFEDPQECYLFRFTYNVPVGRLSNVGIAGPLTAAFTADMANLPADDIYAAFAGWHAEHDEIYEVPPSQWNSAQRREAQHLQSVLEAQHMEQVRPIALTFLLGEIDLLANVQQGDKQLCAVTDGHETLCLPVSDSPTSLTPDLVLCIFRGRKLLRAFN